MSVIAFNFTKIAGERKPSPAAKLSIKVRTGITGVKEHSLGNQKTLLFTFSHVISYEPAFATVTMEGDVLVLSNEKEAKEAVESFKKTKRVSPELTQKVMNTVLNRVSIQSLVMTRDLNLPAPIKLPHVVLSTVQPAAAKEAKKK